MRRQRIIHRFRWLVEPRRVVELRVAGRFLPLHALARGA
jgi:hypothetical protein